MNVGKTGEDAVAEWLASNGAQVLYQRWRWQGGEIDTIALAADTLLFVEVKTRQRANLDADGLLAITPAKQAKIVSTAALFLAKHPHLDDYPCRFDVAIVRHQPIDRPIFGKPLYVCSDVTTGKNLLLINYITGAFDAC
jgi:putative endonuclease